MAKDAASYSPFFWDICRVRQLPALLPLPIFLALSLQSYAAEPEPDWRLCPAEDAIANFADADAATSDSVSPELRAQLPTDISGDQLGATEGESTTFSGNVALTRGDQFLGTDNLSFDAATNRYTAQGNVRYQDSAMRLVADSAEGDQDADSHNVRNVRYQLIERRGNGGAGQIELQGSQGSLYDSTYSTCPSTQRMWELEADRIDLDTSEGTGIARNAILRVGKVPVLFVPWFPFPIDNRRRTGLLYPSISLSGRNGFDWRQPIYFNLAPNYDDTLEPRLMTERGLMISNEFRYLTRTGKGILDFSYLPNDQLTEDRRAAELTEFIDNRYDLKNRRKDNRGRLHFQASQNLTGVWQARANLNWLSDPRYVEDFSSRLDSISSYSITSNVGVYGRGRYWNAGLSADHVQLTDYTLRESRLRYDRLPRAFLNWEQPFGRWLTVGLNAEAVRFAHIDNVRGQRRLADGQLVDYDGRPGGSRYDFKPYVTAPLEGSSWYVRPTLAWRYTGYQLDTAMADKIAFNRATASLPSNTLVSPELFESLRDDSPSRNVPIASFDTGLFFDRETKIGGTGFFHTLEPRLFYLNAPYRNQDAIPLFDTSGMTFSWGQLFRDNRFTGADRQADANQITLAMTSRLIRQDDGSEKLSASIGQIRYLEDSRTSLLINGTGIARSKSAWVGDANYAINDRWSIGASYQWDPQYSRQDLASVRTRYLIGDEGIINLGYRYRRNPSTGNDLFRQVDFSFLYPLSPSWSLVGRYYYSLLEDPARNIEPKLLESVFGVQWDSCCLAARLVARRYQRNRVGELNDALQLEVELKGLGSAGPDTERRLRRAILGYNRDDLYLVPPPELRGGADEDEDEDDDPQNFLRP